MSQDSFGPHLPEPGYRKRWPKQALALLWRSPLALALLAGLGLVAILPPLGLVGILVWNDMPGAPARILLSMLASPLMAVVAMICTAIYLREDLDMTVDTAHVRRSLPGILILTFLINGALVLVHQLLSSGFMDHVPTPPGSAVSSSAGADDMGRFLLALLSYLGGATSNALIAMAIYSPLLTGGVVGAGLQIGEVRKIDQAMRVRMFSLHLEIFFSVVLMTVVATTVGPFGVLVHAFILAWLYVAAREVIGGISKNTSRQTRRQPAPDALPEAG